MEDKNSFEEKFTVPYSFRVKEFKKTIEELRNHIAQDKRKKYG